MGKRGNYTSFSEVRNQLGFGLKKYNGQFLFRKDIGMEEYFLFCELIINILLDLQGIIMPSAMEKGTKYLIETINANVEKSGFEIKEIDKERLIVEKNVVAIEVADNVPELADTIIEYNHYLLRGDISRKQELLKKIADALEPKRSMLNSINKSAADDFFWMVNKMNVRHNNCDLTDRKNYSPEFAELNATEREQWYDKIYDQSLMLFVLLEYQSRNRDIQAFRKVVGN